MVFKFNMVDGEEDFIIVCEYICFFCKKFCFLRDKIKVFGRSSLEILVLIVWVIKVDFFVYVVLEREKVVICNLICYKCLGKY